MSKREKKSPLDTIDRNKYYTILEMYYDIDAFPWLHHDRQMSRYVHSQFAGENVLNVVEVPGVRKHRFLVKGSDIIAHRKLHGIE